MQPAPTTVLEEKRAPQMARGELRQSPQVQASSCRTDSACSGPDCKVRFYQVQVRGSQNMLNRTSATLVRRPYEPAVPTLVFLVLCPCVLPVVLARLTNADCLHLADATKSLADFSTTH